MILVKSKQLVTEQMAAYIRLVIDMRIVNMDIRLVIDMRIGLVVDMHITLVVKHIKLAVVYKVIYQLAHNQQLPEFFRLVLIRYKFHRFF